jgi:hypothetical protein
MPFRGFASRDFGTGEYKRLALRYPGCRNTETPYLIRAIIISGFHKSGFRDWRLQENLPLGILGVETPKHQTLDMLFHFEGFASQDFGLASTRDLPLDIPGVETLKHHISSTLLSFRGFASRDFASGEYKETDPWVSRLPKHRNTKL